MAVLENPKKIAIIGKAPSSRNLAPYDDQSWQIWTLSNLVAAKEVPRWDVQFEIHGWPYLQAARNGDLYLNWLGQEHQNPIYVAELRPEIPSGVLFPKDEIIRRFGTYFNNTVSWMMAFAITLEPEEIGVWGVDMAMATEYEAQRPSCEFFLGWIRGAGIKLHVPPESDLLKTPRLYGFDADGGLMASKWHARTKELQERLKTVTDKRDHAALKAAFLQGALESQEYYAQSMLGY